MDKGAASALGGRDAAPGGRRPPKRSRSMTSFAASSMGDLDVDLLCSEVVTGEGSGGSSGWSPPSPRSRPPSGEGGETAARAERSGSASSTLTTSSTEGTSAGGNRDRWDIARHASQRLADLESPVLEDTLRELVPLLPRHRALLLLLLVRGVTPSTPMATVEFNESVLAILGPDIALLRVLLDEARERRADREERARRAAADAHAAVEGAPV